MNLTDMKAITIPEGEVQKISVGGVTIWKKPTSSGITPGYTLVDYCQFNADKIFDTKFKPTQNTRIEVGFIPESSSAQYLYGIRSTNNTASVTAYLPSAGAWRFGNTYRNYTVAKGNEYTAIVDKSGVNMNGTLTKYASTLKNFSCAYTLVLGTARTTSGSIPAAQFVGKVLYYRIFENDTPILDWIPCDNPDGVNAFWDNVTNTFVAPL